MELINTFVARHQRRTLEWSKLLSITGGAQILVQALGFLSGLLVIRLLSSQQYAYYTIAYTMLGTMTVLADGGIGAGVMSQGAKVWQDRTSLGGVLSTGLRLRNRFAIVSLLVAGPAMIVLLRRHGASWAMSLLVLTSLIPAFWAALSDSLMEVGLKLRQDIVPLQQNQVMAALARLALTAASVVFLPLAAAGILAAGLSRAWANLRLRKISTAYADRTQPPDKNVQKEILTIVKRILPASIYYCLSGQLTIWLISVFGSTTAVGQVGALSGLSTMMNLFNVMFATLMVPRFARLPSVKGTLLKRLALLQAGLLLLSILIVIATSVFSREVLWVLGGRFSGLHKELVLVAVASCIALIGGSTNQLATARGIVVRPLIFVTSAIAAQVGFAFVLPLSNIVGILWYGIFTTLSVYLIRLVYLGGVLARQVAHS